MIRRITIRAVLAGAYRGAGRGMGATAAMLLHAVEVDDAGRAIRVLCGRVKLDSLADSGALDDPPPPPTCKRCLALLAVRS